VSIEVLKLRCFACDCEIELPTLLRTCTHCRAEFVIDWAAEREVYEQSPEAVSKPMDLHSATVAEVDANADSYPLKIVAPKNHENHTNTEASQRGIEANLAIDCRRLRDRRRRRVDSRLHSRVARPEGTSTW
jgi:hypothetical protein